MHAEPRHRHAAAGQRLSAGQGRPELLDEIAHWHTGLAEGFVACHPGLAASALNDVVQRTIVGIVFLWMCEERGGEPRGQLRELCDQPGIMPRLGSLLHAAARRYHAGVFPSIPINGGAPYLLQSVDEPLRMLVAALAEGGQRTGAYHFPTSLLGQVYERLQQQELSRGADGQLVVNNRAGQRKRSGVYYTPEDVVDDIVAHTLGKLLTERGALAGALSAAARGHLRVMDPACGAGVFLLRAYRRLAEWHLDWYQRHNPERWATARAPPIRPSPHRRRSCAAWQLTISEKGRILRDCVFGVDLDQHAVEVTKLGLLLELLAGESHETLAGTTQSGTVAELPNLAHNIHWGNALLGPDFWTDRSQADGGDVERRRTRTFDWR
ncbi:MAG: N-6 DNA methylase, partial [Planctomycetes bacterium]|nr:N-6 DNA methylase [Planctomycetota bacterium]